MRECFEGIQILLDKFNCLDNNFENFQNDENLWSIFVKSSHRIGDGMTICL